MDRLRFVQGNASRRTISDASHRTLFDAPLRLYDQIAYGQSVCKYCAHVIAAAATRVLLGPPAPLSYSPSFPYGRRLAPGTAARAERRFRLRAERILRRIRVRGRPRRSPPIASLPARTNLALRAEEFAHGTSTRVVRSYLPPEDLPSSSGPTDERQVPASTSHRATSEPRHFSLDVSR